MPPPPGSAQDRGRNRSADRPDLAVSPTRNKVGILVADDHELFRRGLCLLLAHEPLVSTVVQARTVEELRQKVRNPDVGVVLLGQRLHASVPGGIGPELVTADPPAVVLLCGNRPEPVDVLRALRWGAIGCVDQQTSAEDLARHALAAVQGQTAASAEVASALEQALANVTPALTPGEAALLSRLSRGRSLPEVTLDGQDSRQVLARLVERVRHDQGPAPLIL